MEKPVVLVTGTTSGIGLELAKKLWRSDYRVIITARKTSLRKLDAYEFKQTDRFLFRALDITSHDERIELIDEITKLWGGVDILINNAGISYRAVVEHMTDEEEFHQLSTNYLGPMSLVRLVLPHMREKRNGRIINVSSVGGMMAMPTMSSYSASKFALEGATESLWYEVKPWNIKVTLIQPGFIRSGSFKNVYFSKMSAACDIHPDAYCQYYTDMAPFIEKLMNSSITTAEDVANKILKTMATKHPPLRVPATLDARVFFWLRRWLPRWFYHHFLYWNLPGAKKWAERAKQESIREQGPL
ncbi:MAG: oxidoreductase [Bacteriovoracaceae bacterium]|nr:oxidoreductase [Bacteriovoracaceae bacterium]